MEKTSPDKQQMDKKLELVIQPKVIDHLGIKMYQKPVDVVSEFIANAWDADAETVDINFDGNSIVIKDKGHGMTFDQCQKYFLTVGRDRRVSTGKETSEEKERPVLGRKGIGKFAGFGIADVVLISTIAKENGESTSFKMDINSILEHDASHNSRKPIEVVNHLDSDPEKITSHGTEIKLIGVDTQNIDVEEFTIELSRRFLLAQVYDDFEIRVNGQELPESFSDEMEFVFPRDLTDDEKLKLPDMQEVRDGWAIEQLDGHEIKWRVGFYEDTIQIEELRGISFLLREKWRKSHSFLTFPEEYLVKWG